MKRERLSVLPVESDRYASPRNQTTSWETEDEIGADAGEHAAPFRLPHAQIYRQQLHRSRVQASLVGFSDPTTDLMMMNQPFFFNFSDIFFDSILVLYF